MSSPNLTTTQGVGAIISPFTGEETEAQKVEEPAQTSSQIPACRTRGVGQGRVQGRRGAESPLWGRDGSSLTLSESH